MTDSTYCALIRTFNSEATLPATLRSLELQTQQPRRYIIVDSGSIDNTLGLVAPGSIIHQFVGPRFNYAEALNQGLQYVVTKYVLIISSHTVLTNQRAIEAAVDVLNTQESIGAAYFCTDNSCPLTFDVIDKETFDGFNGLWNTCSIIKRRLLQERSFRPDVFTAEDQEWARWLVHEKHMAVARFSGAGMLYNNPRRSSLRKLVNEYTAVAYFAKRDLLGWRNIGRLWYRILTPKVSVRPRQRLLSAWILWRLFLCRIGTPHVASRYF